MKLTIKIVIWMVVANVMLLAVDGYISVHERLQYSEEDTRADTMMWGRVAQTLLADIWRAAGPQRAEQLIRDVNAADSPVQIRFVKLAPGASREYRPSFDDDALKPLTDGRPITLRKISIHGEPYNYTYFPVDTKDPDATSIELAECMTPSQTFAHSAIHRVVVISSVLLLVSAVSIGFIGVRFVGRPLHILKEKATRVGSGDLSGRVELTGHNELTDLGEAMNTMCDQLAESAARLKEETELRLQALEALRHADRLKTVGRLAAGVAHEVGTPLNVIGGRAAMLAAVEVSPEDVRDNAGIIKAQSDRITALIRQLLDFARRRTPHRVESDITQLVRNAISLLSPQAQKRSITIDLDVDADATRCAARVDPGQIQQVLLNLIMNAMQATTEPNSIEVGVECGPMQPPPGHEGRAGRYIRIRIADHGSGISEENLRHLFEPFFTTKQVGEGTGLGLSIAYGIVQEHGGWIDVTSREGVGSCFAVFLPTSDA